MCIQSNCNIQLVDNGGLSVLHYACVGQHMSCVQLLLNNNASVLLQDKVMLHIIVLLPLSCYCSLYCNLSIYSSYIKTDIGPY